MAFRPAGTPAATCGRDSALDTCRQNRIDVWIDGGWGVDALLGEQTRIHRDLDIAVQHRHVPRLRALLEARGYKDVPRDDTRDCNFVLGDDLGHQIDVHSYRSPLDAQRLPASREFLCRDRVAAQWSHATRGAAGPL
jgi:Aminoglycoside-2''-adenylyltransferase